MHTHIMQELYNLVVFLDHETNALLPAKHSIPSFLYHTKSVAVYVFMFQHVRVCVFGCVCAQCT